MIFPGIFAILIIGGGYFIWNAIFKAYPLRKEYKEKPLLVWLLGFLIIIGQQVYCCHIFSSLFSLGKVTLFFLLVIIITISALIFLSTWKKYRG